MIVKSQPREARIFIRIGLPRTASIFLHKSIFSNTSGENFYYNPPDINQLARELLSANASSKLLDLKEKVDKALRNYEDCTVLLHDETYSMVPWTQNSRDNHNNLKTLFPNAKIILCLRYQTNFVLSLYRKCSQINIFQPIQRYLNYHEGQFHPVPASEKKKYENDEYNTKRIYKLLFFVPLDIFSIKFSDLIRNYVSVFGRKNVYIYFYENFVDDPDGQIKGIMEFIGVDYSSQKYPDMKKRVNQSFPTLYCIVSSFIYNFGNFYYRSHLIKWKEVRQGKNIDMLIKQTSLKLYRHLLDRVINKILRLVLTIIPVDIDLLAKDGMREKLDRIFREDNKKLLEYFPEDEIPSLYLR